MELVFGVDVGGVIIAASNENTDTSFFSENYLHSRPTEAVFESIARIVHERFGPNRSYIVSKCGKRVQEKTLEWLEYNEFYRQTGMLPGCERFTRTREGKAPICEELGVTHFVDDRLDVLRHLSTVRHKVLFQGHQKELRKFAHLLPTVTHVESWPEVVDVLTLA